MLKNFKNFVNESTENMGKGTGGDTSLFDSAPFKQKINQPNQTLDLLRLGKQIKTENIDGFIDSIQNDKILIQNRMDGIIKTYTFKEVMKEITKNDKKLGRKINEEITFDRENLFDDDTLVGDVYGDPEQVEEDEEDDIIDSEEEFTEDDDYVMSIDKVDPNVLKYGTEDNPEGLPNGGVWENWEKFQENYELKSKSEEDEEEDDDYLDDKDIEDYVRGTEDNPVKNKRKKNIPSEFT